MKLTLRLLTLAIVVSSAFNSNAQAFEQGKNYVSLGYGYSLVNAGTLFKGVIQDDNFNIKIAGPFTLKYEYAVAEKFGIGVSFGFTNSSINWKNDTLVSNQNVTYNYKYLVKKFTAKARFNWHFGDHDIIDPYFGVGLGYKNVNRSFDSNEPNYTGISFNGNIPVAFELGLGTRFIFSEHLGAFIEMGVGHGFIQAGLTGKF